MNHLINVLYVVVGVLVYDKVIKGMLDKKKTSEGLEMFDEYDGI